MCFSNLPVEFDENGDPYLAEEADEVDRPGGTDGEDLDVELDPRRAYDEIVATVPEVQKHLEGSEPEHRSRPPTRPQSQSRPEASQEAGE